MTDPYDPTRDEQFATALKKKKLRAALDVGGGTLGPLGTGAAERFRSAVDQQLKREARNRRAGEITLSDVAAAREQVDPEGDLSDQDVRDALATAGIDVNELDP